MLLLYLYSGIVCVRLIDFVPLVFGRPSKSNYLDLAFYLQKEF